MAERLRMSEIKSISYNDAIEDEGDVICEHYKFESSALYRYEIFKDLKSVEALVAFHLGVNPECVKATENWNLRGGFNAAVPVLVSTGPQQQKAAGCESDTQDTDVQEVLLRFPMPSLCAENEYPGTCLEKMRCEIASYVYMQQNCPDIRIPRLFGFGFSNGWHYTQASRSSFFRRACLWLRQIMASVLRRPIPSSYLSTQPPTIPAGLTSGYMIIERFGSSFGKQIPLLIRKNDLSSEPEKRNNLFRSVSHIMLSLARIPQPRIGSFRFNYDGTISLDNRPVTCDMIILERRGAPRVLHEDKTYAGVDEYVSDLLTFHDQRFLAAPNAAFDDDDAKQQMSVMAFVRAVSHHFIHPERRNGPFVLRLSDQNASNMMIDDDWNVTGMFDLEWLVSGSVDMLKAPSWLTWDGIDIIAGDNYDAYNKQRLAFIKVFREEELSYDGKGEEEAPLSTMMEDSWTTGRIWFYYCPNSLDAMYRIVKNRLGPLFYPDVQLLFKELYQTWNKDAAGIAKRKVADRRAYEVKLSKIFGQAPLPLQNNNARTEQETKDGNLPLQNGI